MPKVDSISIVIPSLHSPVIDRVIAALRIQSWLPQNFEIVVVGMDKYDLVREDGVVRFVHTDRPTSPARARNIGWRLAQYDAIVFLDADCIPQSDWLFKLIEFVETHQKVGAVLAGMKFQSDNFWTACDQIAVFHEHLWFNRPSQRPNLPSYSLYVPKSILTQVQGFDESYRYPAAEDLDLTMRIRRLEHNLYFNPEPLIIHHPNRNTWQDVWRHSFRLGHESIRVRLRYADAYFTLPWMRSAWAWRVFALPIALAKTAQIQSHWQLWKYAYLIPFIVLAKVAWCWGAAVGIERERKR